MTAVSVNTYTHSVTYLADNILKSFKDIIRLSGLDPSNLADSWDTNRLALRTWLGTGDLQRVTLEIFHPDTNALITRWDIDITYSWTGDGSFWTDTEQLKYAILKAGVAPSTARYELVLHCKASRPDVSGWGRGDLRSTAGFVRQTLGSTIEHHGLGGSTSYWRRA